jgi:hypothetical protein
MRSPWDAAAAPAPARSRSNCSRSPAASAHGGVRAQRRLHLDLVLRELTADQIAQSRGGNTGHSGTGRCRRPALGADEQILLLDAHRRCAPRVHTSIIARRDARGGGNRHTPADSRVNR